MIILLRIRELVTLVKLSCVSCKLKNGSFLGGGKLSCLQGCEPPLSSCGSTRQSSCSQLSARQHTAETRYCPAAEEQLGTQQFSLLFVPKGVQCVSQKWDFQVADICK